MSDLSTDSVNDKLFRGLSRLETAGHERDALGFALAALHGALEDFLRLWVAGHAYVPESSRAAALDRGAFSWKDLLAHLREYGRLTDDLGDLPNLAAQL